MTTIGIDKDKVSRIVWNTLRGLQENGAHPAEVVVALSECVGRTIAAMGEAGMGSIAQREMLDVAIKHMAVAVEKGSPVIM